LEEKLVESQNALTKVLSERKKLETDAAQASDELQETKYELKMVEEKARQLKVAFVKKDEELKSEKEYINELEASKKALEAQVSSLQSRLDDAEEVTKRESKKISINLESRVIKIKRKKYNFFKTIYNLLLIKVN